ncbi:MAG: chromosome partitioning protein ParB [Oligoflexia bacterium]|nr:chromosome partitioning protein ParB [Oligoflexia bacterium]
MVQEVEISSFDLRYEDYRMKHEGAERGLLGSILESGIQEPLEGVDTDHSRILLNGFKRYRCARRLGIGIVPYTSLGSDEAAGIIQILRASNNKGLSILEQASLVDELKRVHGMSVMEIAAQIQRSKAWVSVRTGIIGEMSEVVRKEILGGRFPVYSYMYTLRQFIRINRAKKGEIEEFVASVSGKHLSIREIEQLAYGYFKGSAEFRQQIKEGNVSWVFDRVKDVEQIDGLNEIEQAMIRDLAILQKYMQRVMAKSNDTRYKSNSFYSQANLLSGGILSKISVFSRVLREFYDRSGYA